MHQPLIEWIYNEVRLEDALWIKNLVPGGSKGRGIEVKVDVYGGVGRKAWFRARGAEHIESYDFLGDETVPFLGWEAGITRDQSRAEMILEGANCTFGGVAEMGIWGRV